MTDDFFKIQGLAGQRVLEGQIKNQKSKNCILPALGMSILFEGKLTMQGVPALRDVTSLFEALKGLGISLVYHDKKLLLDIPQKITSALPESESRKTRGIITFSGPLLARTGVCTIPDVGVGGCPIGARPIDLFLGYYAAAGAKIVYQEGMIRCEAAEGLVGCDYTFKKKSVTGTITAIMSASLAHGMTILRNCAIEPEVGHIAQFLADVGVQIDGIGTETITVVGRNGVPLQALKDFENIPDRIEAAGFVLLAVLLGKNISITEALPAHNTNLFELLRHIGVEHIVFDETSISVKTPEGFTLSQCGPFILETLEYPGFATDNQTPMATLATQLHGMSLIHENIFEDRVEKPAAQLQKMGADIEVLNKNSMHIRGPVALKGAEVTAVDIRTGFSLVLSALCAEGESIIHERHLIERGYEDLVGTLRSLGATIV